MGCHTPPTWPSRSSSCGLVILEICPPGEGIFGWVQALLESRVPPCKGVAYDGL